MFNILTLACTSVSVSCVYVLPFSRLDNRPAVLYYMHGTHSTRRKICCSSNIFLSLPLYHLFLSRMRTAAEFLTDSNNLSSTFFFTLTAKNPRDETESSIRLYGKCVSWWRKKNFFFKKCLTRKVYNFDGWSNFTRKFIWSFYGALWFLFLVHGFFIFFTPRSLDRATISEPGLSCVVCACFHGEKSLEICH